MRSYVAIGELINKYSTLPKSKQRKQFGRIVSYEKRKLIEKQNYVGILYLSRFMGDYEKNRLFLKMLEKHPNDSLFVLGFANLDMDSYARAYGIKKRDYDGDENALRKDVESNFDSVLCDYLLLHYTKDDVHFIQELIDDKTWLNSYKMAQSMAMSD